MLRNERQLRESPDAIESALSSPESRGCIYGTVSATEAIQTPIANVEVQMFQANTLALSARTDAQGNFHACVNPDAPEQPWQQEDEVKLRIVTEHPNYAPLTLHRTWTISKPLKLRIFLQPVIAKAPAEPSTQECNLDTDCACGTHKATGQCAIGPRSDINLKKQCPDFCTGIANHLRIACQRGKCIHLSTLPNSAPAK